MELINIDENYNIEFGSIIDSKTSKQYLEMLLDSIQETK